MSNKRTGDREAHGEPSKRLKQGHCGDNSCDGSEPVRNGKFTGEEVEQIRVALKNYQVREKFTQEQIEDKIFVEKQGKSRTLWQELVAAVPGRSYNSVYAYVRRAYNPLRNQGKWMEEEDEALVEAMGKARSWREISRLVGRPPNECQDRWRNHVSIRGNRNTGRWMAAEVEKLKEIVAHVCDQEGGMHWSRVSAEMGGIRSRQQCQDKWNRLTRLSENEKQGGPSKLQLRSPNDQVAQQRENEGSFQRYIWI